MWGKKSLPVLFLLSVLIVFNCWTEGNAEVKEKLNISTSNPLLGMITSFIGGIEVDVKSLTVFEGEDQDNDEDDDHTQDQLSSDIIFLDRLEAGSFDLSEEEGIACHYLYSRVPYERENILSLYYDPATIPFVAQKIMNILTSMEPEKYFYFQRRLAELRSRLQSAVELGRNLLKDAKVLDVTGHTSYLIKATGCDVKYPERDFWEKLESENSRDYYTDLFSSSRKEGRLVVGDKWTPIPVAGLIEEGGFGILLAPPSLEIEFILYINRQYLQIWDNLSFSAP